MLFKFNVYNWEVIIMFDVKEIVFVFCDIVNELSSGLEVRLMSIQMSKEMLQFI